ncbi:unnamed protein product [Cyberlindnera jadinii]|uniref:Small ribosomal subunit protein mS35 n=1 Tax=Cyberlindnera jadinii (strain ATCC 18201 / CBS 1600 / BCRC 20928 / JCM 3617 / NBRC 0987 / NRRL Y-1542) TaxID=983966 RepID=A0A0H5C2D6_CYBJN|nr:unnamed protein product [Cyberlindnera jadinii]
MFRLTTRQFSSSASRLSDLYLHPEKWAGKPAEEILELFKKRRSLLGAQFKPDDAELAALKSTSSHTGVSPYIIEKLYYGGESTALDLNGQKHEDNYSPAKFQYDEYPEAAQEIIRDHREQREYNRIAAYEMPHLSKYRQEYKPPQGKPVTYKYTTYLGEEEYRANRKVTLTLKVKDLGLNEKESHKFKVLAGVRYDGSKDEFKMSSERFEEPLQNTRFLSEVLSDLLKASKDLSQDLSDIPLDQRHVQARQRKRKYKKSAVFKNAFPEEWKRPQDAPKKVKSVLDILTESPA